MPTTGRANVIIEIGGITLSLFIIPVNVIVITVVLVVSIVLEIRNVLSLTIQSFAVVSHSGHFGIHFSVTYIMICRPSCLPVNNMLITLVSNAC